MLSSTFSDLEAHRVALISALNSEELTPIAMEYDYAKPDVDVIESSLQKVRDASAYIGVISRKYGQTPVSPKKNPHGLSLTELEFNEAESLGRPILLFIMGENYLLREADIERDPVKLEKLNAFRERAKQMTDSLVHRVYGTFDSIEDFREKAIHAVAGLRKYLASSSGQSDVILGSPFVKERRASPAASGDGGQTTNPAETNVLRGLKHAVQNWYVVDEKHLEVGQTSFVYRAQDPDLMRTVAIKVFNPFATVRGPDGEPIRTDQLRNRFVEEMTRVAELKHRNVMGVYTGIQEVEYPFVVLEFVSGIHLDKVIQKTGVQPLRKVCKFVSEIADALSYAHQMGYLHHELSPTNILIDKEGHPVISPFRFTGKSSGLVETTKEISLEWLKYQSPEEFRGDEITEVADQYSLGLIAYEMLSGKEVIPYGEYPEIVKAKEEFMSSKIDIKRLRPNCPDGLSNAVTKMLNTQPGNRFQHLEEILEELRRIDLDSPLDKKSPECQMMHEAMDSFDRCRKSKDFFRDFYESLFEKCPFIRERFPVDLEAQSYLLREAIDLVLQFPTERCVVGQMPYCTLFKVAEDHRNRNIDPKLYDVFLEHLLQMVGANDKKWDQNVLEAWKVTIQPAIDYIKTGHRQQTSFSTVRAH